MLDSGSPALYALAVLVGGAAGGALIARDAKGWPLDRATRAKVIASVLLGGLVGCALPAYGAGGIVEWRALHDLIGPKTILGGLLFGFIGAALYKRSAGVDYDTSDAFARGTALMMALGRLGCGFAHCCFGVSSASSWGVDLGDGVRRVPAQMIEAAFLFALFLALDALQRRDLLPNRRLFLLFVVYGGLRYGLEFLREPIAEPLGGLGYYQWWALALAGVGLFQLLKRTPSSDASAWRTA